MGQLLVDNTFSLGKSNNGHSVMANEPNDKVSSSFKSLSPAGKAVVP